MIEELDQGNVIQIQEEQSYDLDQNTDEQETEPSTETKNDPLVLEDRPSCDIPIDYLPEELSVLGSPIL